MLTKAEQYLRTVNDRGQRSLDLNRVYRNIRKPGLFITAYSNLYANKGALTPGTNPEDTIDGMTIERIIKIIDSLKDNTFKWTPVKRVEIPKQNKRGKRPLGLPNWTDKLVQEVIRMVLEAYYEPQFSRNSHGFRPKLGCHTALQQMMREWRGTTWFIEGDIKGCFDNIDHALLLEIMGRQIKDERFLKLIRKMLQAGYLEDWRYHKTHSGTPQGGVLSPLLSNIFLNELDQFMENELMPRYNRGTSNNRKINPQYNQLRYRRRMAYNKGNIELARTYEKQMKSIPYYGKDEEYRRLKYVRYADDFLIGFTGPKAEAEEIKQALRQFLETLKLELSQEKTRITHAPTELASFLGYDITVTRENSKRTNKQRTVNEQIALRVPNEVRHRWSSKYRRGKVVMHRAALLNDSDYEIVKKYNIELMGLVNYYQLAINVSKLYKVKFVFYESLIKTLASKHKQNVSWVYRRYAKKTQEGINYLEARIPRDEQQDLVARFGAKPIRYNRTATIKEQIYHVGPDLGRNELSQRLLANQCELCEKTGPVEGHHIRKLSDLKKRYQGRRSKPPWVVKMIAMHRKALFVCKSCHWEIHNGTYDGKSLT